MNLLFSHIEYDFLFVQFQHGVFDIRIPGRHLYLLFGVSVLTSGVPGNG
jgi:hypothetical protein